MVKESIADLGLTPYAVYGLLTFFGVYAAITVWTMTRLYKQISGWASLPLNDEADRVEDDSELEEFQELFESELEDPFDDEDSVLCGVCDGSNSHDKNFVSIN
ncbi:hypothetical protein [Botrimarina mediterranea]|uniref:Cbb3-type cytochrome oxidase component FixQ n=1 Tax=Botrimarina mediterranea TaxID=2528022 RepID=A0A518K8N4_9BACT|nr:hypothetical protein [Botrimarina mediterranea]QDV74149.1 hypothetical protein Spa11_23490 [Botrimarina mediterranea]QDV78780.1 hypothetical protein K2D_23880 [Planctomycetes bacterium K2D]